MPAVVARVIMGGLEGPAEARGCYEGRPVTVGAFVVEKNSVWTRGRGRPSSTLAMSADDALVAEIDAKLEALKLRLPDLEGKANKKERTAVHKEIYN